MTDPSAVVSGFRFAGVHAGIKADGQLDLGLLVADRPVVAAAVFTKNRVRAAPVLLAAERVERGRAQAILVNSGNANACTGKAGAAGALLTCAEAGRLMGIDPELVLPASTGPIGVPLPTERIVDALPALVSGLREEGVAAFAQAIVTTDQWTKIAFEEFSVGGRQRARVLGVAKGAGMIHPNMATTLAFVVTDAKVHSAFLRKALRTATENTFNAISVDGDTSTNDSILALARGAVPGQALQPSEPGGKGFVGALTKVLDRLAKSIVSDGEGAHHLVRFHIVGAPSRSGAQRLADTVATSLLVKTALHGRDPNWGRFMAAMGRAGVMFDPAHVEIRIGGVVVTRKGVGCGALAEAQAKKAMEAKEYTVRIRVGRGPGEATRLTCDVGHAYVDLNASRS